NVVVDLLLGRELCARNFIELVQHILPVTQPHLLRRWIYLGQSIGNRFFDSFEPRKLLQPPFPFFCVDGSQPLICALLLGKTRDAPKRCNTKQNGSFHIKSPTIAGGAPALQFIAAISDRFLDLKERAMREELRGAAAAGKVAPPRKTESSQRHKRKVPRR